MSKNIASIRRDYILKELSEKEINANPFIQFQTWLNEAIEACVNDPTAMTLATSTSDARPSARIVLLKRITGRGFIFFTNYQSKKGKQLLENPFAALVFYWPELERQIRIEGSVSMLQGHESDEYFYSRPQGSKIGAWASPQSRAIPDRSYLDNMVLRYEKEFASGKIERPEFWGGFCLEPLILEFWQGRANRLHDRIQYSKTPAGWQIERLAP